LEKFEGPFLRVTGTQDGWTKMRMAAEMASLLS
jgi:hypothetical protein